MKLLSLALCFCSWQVVFCVFFPPFSQHRRKSYTETPRASGLSITASSVPAADDAVLSEEIEGNFVCGCLLLVCSNVIGCVSSGIFRGCFFSIY